MSLTDRIRQSALLLDDDGLAALANKGLVRRAHKDVEVRSPEVLGEKDGYLLVRVEDQTVRLDERLVASRCSCPAGTRCRHIVAAVLALARAASMADGAGRAGDALLDVGDEALRQWAGAALMRRALSEVAGGLQFECADGPALVVRFPNWNIVCRFVGPGGLGAALCGCHAVGVCLHAVAAVLAFQIQQGRRNLVESESVLEASAETPRTREDIRLAALTAVETVIARGFSRLDSGMADRFMTLATSAHGVDLPRLERALRGMADEIARWLARDVSASDEDLLLRTALVYALGRALATPRPELVGQHRGRYEPVRDLELVGVGARAWRTASGYQGLTVYFWEPAASRFATWTEARPTSIAGFNPQSRFSASGPWAGCPSPQAASSNRIRLPSAFRSRSGRLSGRPSTTMIRIEATRPEMLSPIADWAELAVRVRSSLASGLTEPDENSALVLLAPAQWGAATFELQRQELRRPLMDAKGKRVMVTLAQSPENDSALKELEFLSPGESALLFGRLAIQRGELTVQPIAIVDSAGVRSLGLHTPGLGTTIDVRPAEGDEDEFDLPEQIGRETVFGSPIGRALATAWDELEAIAAAGAGARHSQCALGEARAQLSSLGLARVAAALAAVECARTQSNGLPRALLEASWTVRLAESVLVVERAVAELG